MVMRQFKKAFGGAKFAIAGVFREGGWLVEYWCGRC